MTDYTRSTGSSATMMIRDTGTSIEFWITSGNSTTWTDHLPWSGTVNGSSVGGSYNYQPGVGWKRLGVWPVSTNQNVTFNIGNTGTSGFGGPTTLGPIYINRATVPPAPNAVTFSSVTSTSVVANFTSNGDGGSVIFTWNIGYGTDPTGTTKTVINSLGTSTISGLTPGETYYFWARGNNAQGSGPWSTRSQVTTLRVPDAPSAPVISNVTQVSLTATFTPNGDGGTAITGYQVGYGTSSSAPTTTVSATSPKNITGLSPGIVYYFWVRAQNSVGNSPWSTSIMVTMIAGARVMVGAVAKNAIPYVRQGGVWKVARPMSKIAGVWKESI